MELSQVLDILKTGGPLAPFLIFWWLERRERVAIQKDKDDWMEKSLNALNATATSLKALSDVLSAKGV